MNSSDLFDEYQRLARLLIIEAARLRMKKWKRHVRACSDTSSALPAVLNVKKKLVMATVWAESNALAHQHLHEHGSFRNALCDIVIVASVAADHTIKLEIEGVGNSAVEWLEHLR